MMTRDISQPRGLRLVMIVQRVYGLLAFVFTYVYHVLLYVYTQTYTCSVFRSSLVTTRNGLPSLLGTGSNAAQFLSDAQGWTPVMCSISSKSWRSSASSSLRCRRTRLEIYENDFVTPTPLRSHLSRWFLYTKRSPRTVIQTRICVCVLFSAIF